MSGSPAACRGLEAEQQQALEQQLEQAVANAEYERAGRVCVTSCSALVREPAEPAAAPSVPSA